jgi:hypothetical protein
MCLWDFSWNCCDFRSIFHAFKQILGFSRIVFALKIISKKKKKKKKKTYPIYLGLARRPDPSRPPAQPRPALAHPGPDPGCGQCPWRTRPGVQATAAPPMGVPHAHKSRPGPRARCAYGTGQARRRPASQELPRRHHGKPSRRARRPPPAGLRSPLHAPADGEPSTEFPSSSSLDSTSQSNP